MSSSTSDPLYRHYKRARNKLRRLELKSYISNTVDVLYKAHLGGPEVMRHYQPWNILLALKWYFQELDGLQYRRPATSLNDLHDVLNILHEMEGDVVMPSQYSHFSLFMRRIAFQQFWLHKPDGSALARQQILFAQLQKGHQFQRQFFQTTGVSISDFLDLAFALLALLLGKNPPRAFKRSIFQNIEPQLTPGALDGFLKHLSRTPEELRTWFNEPVIRSTSVSDQTILPSPLMRAPLLKMDDLYVIYYPPLAYRSLEECIYRTIRSPDPAAFMQKFGPMFERYAEQCLTEAKVVFTTETELKQKLPGTGKVVDFLVVEEGCNILIDTKGVEASPLGRVSYEAEVIYRSLKESAMKAIIQGMDVARRIGMAESNESWGRSEKYLLVVTFEELYLGCSSDLSATFGAQLTASLQREFDAQQPFPLEHVFFLSVGEFEYLLQKIRDGSTTFMKAINHAKKSDGVRETRKFNFGQHLRELGAAADRLPFIDAGLKRLQDNCIARMKPTTAT